MASKLSNCLLHSLYFWASTKSSKIKCYYNTRYKTISFYVVTKTHEIKFSRDKSKPKICKILFYVNVHKKQLYHGTRI